MYLCYSNLKSVHFIEKSDNFSLNNTEIPFEICWKKFMLNIFLKNYSQRKSKLEFLTSRLSRIFRF